MIEIKDAHYVDHKDEQGYERHELVGKDADDSEWMLVVEDRYPGPHDVFACCECGGIINVGAWLCYLDLSKAYDPLRPPRTVCRRHVRVEKRQEPDPELDHRLPTEFM